MASKKGQRVPKITPEQHVSLVRQEIKFTLAELANHFVPEAVLTFIMRVPGKDDQEWVVTDDDLDGIIETIERFKRRANDTNKKKEG